MNDVSPMPKLARVMRREETIISKWAHIIDADTPWRAALEPSYYAQVAHKLEPGSSIEVHTADHAIAFLVYVKDVNVTAAPVFLDIAFSPLCPADLDLPQPKPQAPARYVVREAAGGGSYRVVDLQTGQRALANDTDRRHAMEVATEMNNAVSLSETLQTASFANLLAAAQSVTDETDEAPVVSPGAERTRRYRARQREQQQQGVA
jgi:hypothetical protein